MKTLLNLAGLGQAEVVSISSLDTLKTAALAMCRHHVGVQPVLVKGDVHGILSKRDILRAIAMGRDPEETLVGNFMSTEVLSLCESESLERAGELMRRAGVKHLPFTRGAAVVGLTSLEPVMLGVQQDLSLQLSQLQQYVFGR